MKGVLGDEAGKKCAYVGSLKYILVLMGSHGEILLNWAVTLSPLCHTSDGRAENEFTIHMGRRQG